MARSARVKLGIVALLLAASWALTGCSGQSPAFVDSGASYEKESALDLLGRIDSGDLASRPAAEGIRLRHDALSALRRRGKAASQASDLLTRTFPSDTAGVPLYVERATYEGRPAVLVVEAVGRDQGTLSSRRLWVLADNGDVLFAGSR